MKGTTDASGAKNTVSNVNNIEAAQATTRTCLRYVTAAAPNGRANSATFQATVAATEENIHATAWAATVTAETATNAVANAVAGGNAGDVKDQN